MKPVKLHNFQVLFIFALGAALPDIIDKPLYYFFGYGRSLMHSVIIITIVFLVLLYLFRDRYRVIFTIGYFMVLLHFVMDSMWSTPEILLYPLMGSPPEFGTFGFTLVGYLSLLSSWMIGREAIIAAVCGLVLVHAYVTCDREDDNKDEEVMDRQWWNP